MQCTLRDGTRSRQHHRASLASFDNARRRHDDIDALIVGIDRNDIDEAKFRDPDVTATGEVRASVRLRKLETLWFNTGTLCNLTCANCYIESSPSNDRLAYLRADEVQAYLD